MYLALYQTAARLYVVRQGPAGSGTEEGEEEFRVLKLDRTAAELEASEDPTSYTRPQLQRLLAAIHAGKCMPCCHPQAAGSVKAHPAAASTALSSARCPQQP